MATSWGWPYSRFERGRTTQGQRRLRYLPGRPSQPHQTHLGHRSSTTHQPPVLAPTQPLFYRASPILSLSTEDSSQR